MMIVWGKGDSCPPALHDFNPPAGLFIYFEVLCIQIPICDEYETSFKFVLLQLFQKGKP